MSDNIRAAIDEMTVKLKAKVAEVADLKRTINMMARVAGDEPPYPEDEPEPLAGTALSLRPDQFFRKPFAGAAREFLELRKLPMSTEEILKGLERGGFNFDELGWRGENRLRNVAISLAKNSGFFIKLPSGAFGLRAWYPEEPTKRRTDDAKPKPKDATANGSNGTTEGTDKAASE